MGYFDRQKYNLTPILESGICSEDELLTLQHRVTILEKDQEIIRLRKAVGEQTDMVRKWRNRANHQRKRANKAEHALTDLRREINV